MIPLMNKYTSASSGADGNDGHAKPAAASGSSDISSPLHNPNGNSGSQIAGVGFNLPQGMAAPLQQQQSSGSQAIALPSMMMMPQQQSAPSVVSFPPNVQFPQSLQPAINTPNSNFNQFLMALNYVGMPSSSQFPLQGLAGLNPGILCAMAAGAQQQQQQLLQQQQQLQKSAAPNSFSAEGLSPNLKGPAIGASGVAASTSSSEASAPAPSAFMNAAGLGMNPAALQLLQGMGLGSVQPVPTPTNSQSAVSSQQSACKAQSQAPQALKFLPVRARRSCSPPVHRRQS
jgi:hypothetical protein